MPNNQPYYGDAIVGLWFCSICAKEWFPLPLKESDPTWLGDGWACPWCGHEMFYDEAA